jgi:hypothetical protein
MDDDQKVWRYMSFARFMWMLQRRLLWLSRADKLEDPWELAITGEEISYLYGRAPITPLGSEGETPLERTKRIMEQWRTTTFVNCWCALNHESHALWRVFCGPKEGVTIQTTWQKLTELAENMRLVEVNYASYDEPRIRTPKLEKVSIRKRRMFDYEHEVRIIAHSDTQNPNLIVGEFGCLLSFDPVSLIDAIVVHPEADQSFYEVVFAAVDTYVPNIRDRVRWSDMRELPPMITT